MTKFAAPDDCPLCGMAQGRLPAQVVYEAPRLLAVLDSNPIRPGHVRIIPRAHYPCFNALPPDLAAAMLDLGQRLAEGELAVTAAGLRLALAQGREARLAG